MSSDSTPDQPRPPSGAERRQSPRYNVVLDVTVRLASGDVLAGRSRDISQNGIFIQLGEACLPTDQQVQLEIRPPGAEGIQVTGMVVHRLPSVGNGVQFLGVSPRAVALIDALIEALGRP
jgi:hypothetical protein